MILTLAPGSRSSDDCGEKKVAIESRCTESMLKVGIMDSVTGALVGLVGEVG